MNKIFVSSEEKNFSWKNLYLNYLTWSKVIIFHDENILTYLVAHKIILC